MLMLHFSFPWSTCLASPCRPLFSDYWERFVQCLTALRDKQQRTVYRLTLVRGMNMASAQEYAALIDLGQPDVGVVLACAKLWHSCKCTQL
jgi:wyosine [tRNA(Phe)-imidazoG37] synthetase (radical SAM superfamily)